MSTRSHLVVLLFLLAAVGCIAAEQQDGVIEQLEDEVQAVANAMEGKIIELKFPSKLRGESNFFDIKVSYIGPGTLYVRNGSKKWGKWVPGDNNYSKEIGGPNGKSCKNGESIRVAAAGRSWSPSGTEGSFDLVAEVDGVDEKLFHIYWDCGYQSRAYMDIKTVGNASQLHSRIGQENIRSHMCATYSGYDKNACKVW